MTPEPVTPLTITAATPGDVPTIAGLIKALAEYERLAHEVVADDASIHRSLFGDRPVAEAAIARVGETTVGFALFFHNYSTWRGRQGIYLEDLFVEPAHRGRGYGKQLLVHLARLAVERGCARMEWNVLDWNAPAIAFYRSLGAAPLSEWTVFRLTGEALVDLARTPGR